MTKTIDTTIPAFLKRETNAKGVTLSAGVEAPKPVAVTKAAKVAKPKPVKAEAPKPVKAPKSTPVKAEAPKPVKAEAPKSTPVTVAPALGPDGQPLEKVSRSIVPMRFKAKYAKANGTCGDDMALELKAATTTRNADKREVLDVEALWAIAKSNGVDYARYVDLNNGQKRMNVGNKLRGKLAAGEDVTIGQRQFKAEDWQPRAK